MTELLWWVGQFIWLGAAALGLAILSYRRWHALQTTEPTAPRLLRLQLLAVGLIWVGMWLASQTWQERLLWTVVGALWWYLRRDFAR